MFRNFSIPNFLDSVKYAALYARIRKNSRKRKHLLPNLKQMPLKNRKLPSRQFLLRKTQKKLTAISSMRKNTKLSALPAAKSFCSMTVCSKKAKPSAPTAVKNWNSISMKTKLKASRPMMQTIRQKHNYQNSRTAAEYFAAVFCIEYSMIFFRKDERNGFYQKKYRRITA